jgi:hypothetical protein
MSAPVCPSTLELKNLIELYDSISDNEDAEKTVNALRYLETYLSNRRVYQRKMQIRRKILARYATEQGWDQEIDDAVKAVHGNDIEKMSLEDDDEKE